jgi:Domain of unknown function DUF29
MGRNAARKEKGTTAVKEADLYSWARRQAELRAGKLTKIDPAAIAEEIDGVGEEQYHRLESALRVLTLHLLKGDHDPDKRSRSCGPIRYGRGLTSLEALAAHSEHSEHPGSSRGSNPGRP